MKKLVALENIKVEEVIYKKGESFSINDEGATRLIEIKAAEFVSSEIEDEEENHIGKKKTKKVKEDE